MRINARPRNDGIFVTADPQRSSRLNKMPIAGISRDQPGSAGIGAHFLSVN